MSSSNRRAYLTATVLNQALLDATYQDNLDGALELACRIAGSSFEILASDRNKYVGNKFYEALLSFPVISRKIAAWLQNAVEFSTLSLELSNVDGRFNHLLIGGADYEGFIGKTVEVKVGLRDVAATYSPVFTGRITDVAGAARTTKSIVFTARDSFDKGSTAVFPQTAIKAADWPDVEQEKVGLAIPIIYGDWTTAVRVDKVGVGKASVPVFCVNGTDAIANPGSSNAKFLIAGHALTSFDTNNVYLLRGDVWTLFDPADVVNVASDHSYFELVQNGATVVTPPDGTTTSDPWVYEAGDTLFVRVVGSVPSGNAVLIAKDILETYGDFSSGDFDATWASFAAKSTPAESAVASILSRAWVQETQSAIEYAASMLAQVRLQLFENRSGKLSLTSQHFDEWDAAGSVTIRNWDVVKDTFRPTLDAQNNFNRARAVYDRDPSTGDSRRNTGFFNNAAAVTQVGWKITKQIDFPNLYVASDVENQLKEILKLASAGSEMIAVTLTGRGFLLDLGEWVLVNVQIGSSVFANVPAQVREIGYDPAGLRIPVVLWSMQAVPFPGWAPGYAGLVGGQGATISPE